MESLLPLGPAPRPVTGDDLVARLRDLLRETAGPAVRGLESAQVLAVLDGADVDSLDIDLTGVAFSPAQGQSPDIPATVVAEVTERVPATLRTLRVAGHPVTAVDLDVDLDADLHGIPFAWVTSADGTVGAELVEPGEDAPVTGKARLAVASDGLAGMVQGLLAVTLSNQGVQLTQFDFEAVQAGPRGAALQITAGIRKGMFMSATVTATASAAIDDAMVLTVGDIQLTSGNPLVSAMLGAVRGRLDAAAGRKIDLAAALPPGVQLTDVRLDVGEQIVLSAQLG